MTHDAILAVVARNISETVEGLSASAVDPARSMTDYGLGSLDVVEVVSRSMRDLQVTVPRTELRRLTTIGGLVDLLYRSTAERGENLGQGL